MNKDLIFEGKNYFCCDQNTWKNRDSALCESERGKKNLRASLASPFGLAEELKKVSGVAEAARAGLGAGEAEVTGS